MYDRKIVMRIVRKTDKETTKIEKCTLFMPVSSSLWVSIGTSLITSRYSGTHSVLVVIYSKIDINKPSIAFRYVPSKDDPLGYRSYYRMLGGNTIKTLIHEEA